RCNPLQFLLHSYYSYSNFGWLRALTSSYSNLWRIIYHYCYTNPIVEWFIRYMVWLFVLEKGIGICHHCAYVGRFLCTRVIYADILLSNQSKFVELMLSGVKGNVFFCFISDYEQRELQRYLELVRKHKIKNNSIDSPFIWVRKTRYKALK